MSSLTETLRSAGAWLLRRLPVVLVAAGLLEQGWRVLRDRRRAALEERSAGRRVLPSLYEKVPGATRAPRRPLGVRSVPLDRIVGTMRHPSQNTADFKPLPRLRGENWRARWQRIKGATNRLEVLPPVDLVQVGDEYFVADGHNRVAAARRLGAIEIDAVVTQLVVPGITQPGQAVVDTASLMGNASVRQAASGRLSRTVERRSASDRITRRELAGEPGGAPASEAEGAEAAESGPHHEPGP